MLKKLSICFLLFLICLNCSDAKRSTNIRKGQRDYVPNAETAIRVAEAIWLPIYGNVIYNEKPFVVKLKDSKVWVVEGSLKPGDDGGTAYIEIQKRDCKILKVTHGK